MILLVFLWFFLKDSIGFEKYLFRILLEFSDFLFVTNTINLLQLDA